MEQRVAHTEQELQKQIDELRKLVWELQINVKALMDREARGEAE